MRGRYCLTLSLVLVACFNPPTVAADAGGSTGEMGTTTTMPGSASMTGASSSMSTSSSASTTVDPSTTGPMSTTTSEASSSSTTGTGETSTTTTGGVVYSHTVYLNFEGVSLSLAAADDAPNDEVSIDQLATDYMPYGDSPQPDGILALVEEDFEAYDVLVTLDRPAAGPYTMVVVSPTNPISPGVLTIATSVDCSNANDNNLAFAFFDADSGFTNQEQANVISSAIGHTYGLDNAAQGTGDLMENFFASDDRGFADECLDLDLPPGVCQVEHVAECGPTDQQNTHQELLTTLGASPL